MTVFDQDFGVRCRIHGISGDLLNLSQFRRKLAIAQADVDEKLLSVKAGNAFFIYWKVWKMMYKVFFECGTGCFERTTSSIGCILARFYGTHSLELCTLTFNLF
ncbi:hypothetical protein MEC_00210 [Bartonella alsatica IBS 382]|uniref:Uncharacterized protein n=1 Tax=Bartonella alsatica IBS 382 TaxID=1094551 RepID=J1IWN9_9HYPH|nr:hypothetical protein MEC_00210 [Bartonella alsatica IBS 382]